MAIKAELKVYPGVRFPAQGFALMSERFSTVKSVLISGCEVTAASASELILTDGWALVRGRLVQITGDTLGASDIPSISGAPLYVMLSVDITTGAAAVQVLDASHAADCVDTLSNETNLGIAYLALAIIDSSWNVTRQVYDVGYVTEITIPSASWVSVQENNVDTGVYSYTYSNGSITTTSNQEILPPLQGSMSMADFKAMLKAIQLANIQDGGQAAGSMTLLCTGAKPSIEIKLRVLFRGGNYI